MERSVWAKWEGIRVVPVGWVERSEAHRPIGSGIVGLAALDRTHGLGTQGFSTTFMQVSCSL